ncbi:MAG: immunoglobulin domain-containing protein, partial [Verrucomicrobiota bacterium]
PAFNWEAAGKDGLPLDHEVDGMTRYDGNWNFALQTDPTLDYIVAYSGPSWNSQFGDINKPAWLAVHRLDGSIASGKSSVKLDFNEDDEIIESNGAAGHDFLYDPWVQVVPDQTAAANLDKSEVLVSFGSAGFGVFEVQNVAAKLVSSPASQTVAAGTEVTLVANVEGSPNAFQWYHDGQPLDSEPNLLGVHKSTLVIKNVSSEDAGKYQLKWTNPITGAGQTAEATLKVTGDVSEFQAAQIVPEGPLAVEVPAGSVTANGPDAITIKGPGLVAWPAAANADQPGDVQEFAYESISGDFDVSAKVESIESGPRTDPVDAWASGGLQARVSLSAISPSFLVNVGNPKGVNEVRAIGRAIEGQNYTTFGRTYGGVDKNLPNQWVRLRRVGNWFAAYVGTDGKNWSLIGQRWQEWPGTLLVGAYAFSASYNSADQTGGKNLATVKFSSLMETDLDDTTPPALVSAGTLDKKTVGVRFSEPVNSLSATQPFNYKLSQGSVTSVRPGAGGDSVYLTVTGLTSDSFSVTVLGGIVDTSGNPIRAGSTVSTKASAWKSTDIGLIQSGDPAKRTPGDDPYRIGQAIATSSGDTETEIEIIGGGSNAWNPGDYIHYVSGPKLNGDFDVSVEVSRNDRPANTAAWANSGLMLRESEYVPGQQYTQDGTKVAMVANTTYIEGSAPNRAGIPLWREEPGAGYGNGNPGFAWTTPIGGIKGYYLNQRAIDAAGTPDPESSPLSSRWLRIKRAGNDFTFFVSYDGWEWALLDGPKTLPLSSQLLFGFSTMSDTGSGAPPNNAYGGNGFLGTDLEGQQNPSNYSVQRIRIGTTVTPRGPGPVTPTVSIQGSTVTFTGKLQEASSLSGTFKDVPG